MKMKFTKVRIWSSSCVLYGQSQCVLLVESVKTTAYRVMEGVGLLGNNLIMEGYCYNSVTALNYKLLS